MPNPVVTAPAAYAALSCLAIGREGSVATPIDFGNPLPVTEASPRRPTYRSGVVGFAPVAAATDIFALWPQFYGRTIAVEQIVLSGTSTSGGVLDVLVQRSINGGGGTSAALPASSFDRRDRGPTASLYSYTANRTSNGNGIDANRPLVAAGKLHLGTATVPGNSLVFRFGENKRPLLRDLTEWLVVNLNGQTIPAGCSLTAFVEWSEEPQPPVQFAGDSTTSNAIALFNELAQTGALSSICNFNNSGSNGYRLEDALLNTNGIPFPLVGGNGILSRLNGMPGVLVLCYGINDMRQGARTRAELISMIDAAIFATLNGTTSGATYTSPVGAGTTFTWPATVAANSDCRIVLWGPNMITTDGNGGSFVTLAGRYSGMTLAQAAQTMTDDLYEAHEFFRNDPRIFRLVQKQDVFGRTAVTVAASGAYAQSTGITRTADPLMTDILHPNARGQALSARQIAPHVRDAVASAQAVLP